MITASREVKDQLEEIRESGVCNMLDFDCIQLEADSLGFFNLVTWMENYIGRRDWGKAIMKGIKAEDEND